MKRKLQLQIAVLAVLCSACTIFAQKTVTYKFDSVKPLLGLESASGTLETLTFEGFHNNGILNSTSLLHPKTAGSPNKTGVCNLDACPDSSDYSVTWKEYIAQGNTVYKKGFLLRGSGVGGYTTGIKEGYFFMVQNNATTGSVTFRIINSSAASSLTDLQNSGAVIIPGFAVNKACWFRASATGNVLKLEYSTDGFDFKIGATYTDTANLYASGATQLIYGIGSGAGCYYYDDIVFKSLASGLQK